MSAQQRNNDKLETEYYVSIFSWGRSDIIS